MNNLDYIKINNDMWDDCGKIYRVLSYYRHYSSTAAHLELEKPNGDIEKRVVPVCQIEWIEHGDL